MKLNKPIVYLITEGKATAANFSEQKTKILEIIKRSNFHSDPPGIRVDVGLRQDDPQRSHSAHRGNPIVDAIRQRFL